MAESSRDWNVLWSQQQNVFHIEKTSETISSGLEALNGDRETQYVLVAFGLSRKEASEFAKNWHDTLHICQIARDAKRDYPFARKI